jgi:hypothetical protein
MDLDKLREELDQRYVAEDLDRQIEQSVPWANLNHIDFQLKQHTDILARLSADDSRRAEIEQEVATLSAKRVRLIAEYPQLGRAETRNDATGIATSPKAGADQSGIGESAQVSQAAQEPSEPKKGRTEKKPVRRNAKYETIDKALNGLADARPRDHEAVFRSLDDRKIAVPNCRPFKAAGGWLKGFHKDPHAARAWLSRAWSRLGLPAFARGPKK